MNAKESKDLNSELNMFYLSIDILIAGRRAILKTTIFMIIIGVVYALLSPVYYKSSTTFLSQSSQEFVSTGGLASIASLAGFNLNMGNTSEVSPLNYGQIIGSMPFMLDVLNDEIVFNKNDKAITIRKYYENKKPSVIGIFKSYTIGILGKLKNIFKKNESNEIVTYEGANEIIFIDKKTKDIVETVLESVSLFVNEENGAITISCEMPTRIGSAQIVHLIREKLQEYVTAIKITNAKENYDFVRLRYEEVDSVFLTVQNELANFKDHNKYVGSELYRIKEKELERKYDLVYGVLTELAKQQESAKLHLKESTPIFNVLQPATVPIDRIRPQRTLIVLMFTFSGLLFGFIFVFVRRYLTDFYNGYRRHKRMEDSLNE